jgi:dihydrofolate reductase
MSLKCSVFIATSLDGYIARSDDGLDWLDAANRTITPGEDCGYKSFIETVDVLVMGRGSFEVVLGFPEWPYEGTRVVVMSSKPVAIPERLRGAVSSTSEAPAALVERLSAEGARHAYVDGGVTIQSFLRAGLIDEITITLIPVLLGSGKPLFGPVAGDIALRLIESRAYPFGFVQVKYAVTRG